MEVGVFGPLRFGLADQLEISAHPLWLFLIPQIAVKKGWTLWQDWHLASRHQLIYPTMLLRALAREGAGGVLPPSSEIPHLLTFQNELWMSRPFGAQNWFTARVGVLASPRVGPSDFPTIELPVVYPRTASYHSDFTAYLSAHWLREEIRLWGFPFGVQLAATVFALPEAGGRFHLEQDGEILLGTSDRFRASLGYKWIYGEYPFGAMANLLPIFDLQWGF